jgi:aspartate racemase
VATKRKLTVGIIGGMGPAATCALFARIIAATPARCDQEHLHVIVDNDPSVPDRTAALTGSGLSPVPHLVRSARLLEAAGCRLLAMPCVTAHAFLADVRGAVAARVLSIVEETARAICADYPQARRVGLLATDGTLQADTFGPLREKFELLQPSVAAQRQVMTAIYGPAGVKTVGANAAAAQLLRGAAAELAAAGADVLVAGCTEVPLVLTADLVGVPLVDTLDVLARAVVREAGAS